MLLNTGVYSNHVVGRMHGAGDNQRAQFLFSRVAPYHVVLDSGLFGLNGCPESAMGAFWVRVRDIALVSSPATIICSSVVSCAAMVARIYMVADPVTGDSSAVAVLSAKAKLSGSAHGQATISALGRIFASNSLGNVFLFRAPNRPARITIRFIQATGYDDAGDFYSYNKGAGYKRVHALQWQRLAIDKVNELNTFFRTIAKGSKHTFLWQDHDGYPRTVRFAKNTLPQKNSPNLGRGDIEVELEEEIIL